MTIEISYWRRSRNENIPGAEVSAESLSISGTSARSAVTPDCDYVKITATEAARVSYTSATSTAAATTPYLLANETLWLDAVVGWKVAGKTP